MRVLISGSSGLIGSALVELLAASGHEVIHLVRRLPRSPQTEVRWEPQAGVIDAERLEGMDAVVNLAGENIGGGRWTGEKMARIRDSRVASTFLLSQTLVRLARPPKVIVSASAVGYYGHRGDQVLREDSPPGEGFMADVCRQWEAATAPAAQRGIRVVHPRLAMVLAASGGALPRMVNVFRAGIGGRIASGRQWWSWVSLDDAIAAIHRMIVSDSLAGPVNVASPEPVTNREFARTLARVLSRPVCLPLPAWAARLVLGRMADEILLASIRVAPARLRADGFRWRHLRLEPALREILGR